MKSLRMLIVVCCCLLAAGGCRPPPGWPGPPPPTPTPTLAPLPPPSANLIAPAKAWADALYKGDLDAALEHFADSVSWTGSYQGLAVGKGQLRRLFELLDGLETKYQITDCQLQASTIDCATSFVDSCMASFGAPDGLPAKLAFEVQPDGKIRKVAMTYDDPRWADFLSFIGATRAWVTANRAEESQKIVQANRQAGSTIGRLCKEYTESFKVTPTPVVDFVAPVKAWPDAFNKGDPDAALEPFADTIWWKGSYERSAVGKEQLRPVFDYLGGLETNYQVTDCKLQGSSVDCAASIVDSCVAAFGAPDGLPAKLVFEVQPDLKIRKVAMTTDDPQWNSFSRFMGAMRLWGMSNRPEDMPKTQDTSREAGSTVAALCRDYAKSIKPTPTPQVDLIPPAKAWTDPFNKGDLDAALEPFAETVSWSGSYERNAAGKGQLRSQFDYLSGLQTKYRITDCQRQGSTVNCAASFVDGCVSAFGAPDGLPAKLIFDVQPDLKVRSVSMTTDDPRWTDFSRFMGEMRRWGMAVRSTEMKETQDTSREAGSTVAALCREYAQTKK